MVAKSIAALARAPVTPEPFRPVLRGLLLTGNTPAYVRGELRGGQGEASLMDMEPLWWPPSKIAGHYLSRYIAPGGNWRGPLATHSGSMRTPDAPRRSPPQDLADAVSQRRDRA